MNDRASSSAASNRAELCHLLWQSRKHRSPITRWELIASGLEVPALLLFLMTPPNLTAKFILMALLFLFPLLLSIYAAFHQMHRLRFQGALYHLLITPISLDTLLGEHIRFYARQARIPVLVWTLGFAVLYSIFFRSAGIHPALLITALSSLLISPLILRRCAEIGARLALAPRLALLQFAAPLFNGLILRLSIVGALALAFSVVVHWQIRNVLLIILLHFALAGTTAAAMFLTGRSLRRRLRSLSSQGFFDYVADRLVGAV